MAFSDIVENSQDLITTWFDTYYGAMLEKDSDGDVIGPLYQIDGSGYLVTNADGDPIDADGNVVPYNPEMVMAYNQLIQFNAYDDVDGHGIKISLPIAVNDLGPWFDENMYIPPAIDGDDLAGTVVIDLDAQLGGYDESALNYSLNDTTLFSIDNDGIITLNSDNPVEGDYDLTVTVENMENGWTDTAQVQITVDPGTQTPVNQAPVFAAVPTQAAIDTDSAVGTVIMDLDATDDGGAANLTYALNNAAFDINADGVITLADDTIVAGTYAVTATVTDAQGLTDTEALSIVVDDATSGGFMDLSLDGLGGTLAAPAAQSALGDGFNFTDDVATASVTTISDFGGDDQLTLVGVTEADVSYSESNGDAQIEFDDGAGAVSRVVLTGVAAGGFDGLAGFNAQAAVGDIVFA